MDDELTHTIRASDAERDAVGDQLRRHHADGRLDTDELQIRISRCYSATTRGELDRLLADLPREPSAGERSAWSGRRRRWPPMAVVLFVVLVATVTAGHDHGHGPAAVWPVLLLAFIFARMIGARMTRGVVSRRR
jgi:hypothetical protein